LCALPYIGERDEWQITANKVQAHLAISGAEGTQKRDDCNLPDGPRVDVEKSTLAAKASRQSSTKTALFVSIATLSELMTTKIQTYTKWVNIKY
jgi:hypothetical protein